MHKKREQSSALICGKNSQLTRNRRERPQPGDKRHLGETNSEPNS